VGGQWEVGGAKEGDGTVNMIKILNMQVLKCRNETYMVKKIKNWKNWKDSYLIL
jgi:hypothetical protein